MAVDNATILDKVRTKGTDDYQQRIPSATQTGVANTMRYCSYTRVSVPGNVVAFCKCGKSIFTPFLI